MATRGRGLFSLYIYIENFKHLLVRNQWTDFNITWQECFFGHPLLRLFKPSWFVKKYCCKGAGLIFPIYLYRKLEKNLLVRNHWTSFNITWQTCFLGDSVPRLFMPSWFVKTYGCYGWVLFPIYIYIENLNDLLVRNHWTDLNITLQECVLCNPLSRLFKPSWFVKTHGSQWAGLIFPIYLYRKLLKKFLVISHWTDFNITWQKYFLGDRLPRFFK